MNSRKEHATKYQQDICLNYFCHINILYENLFCSMLYFFIYIFLYGFCGKHQENSDIFS